MMKGRLQRTPVRPVVATGCDLDDLRLRRTTSQNAARRRFDKLQHTADREGLRGGLRSRGTMNGQFSDLRKISQTELNPLLVAGHGGRM